MNTGARDIVEDATEVPASAGTLPVPPAPVTTANLGRAAAYSRRPQNLVSTAIFISPDRQRTFPQISTRGILAQGAATRPEAAGSRRAPCRVERARRH